MSILGKSPSALLLLGMRIVLCLVVTICAASGKAALGEPGTPSAASFFQQPAPGSQSITQPLSPVSLNVFNFGPHKFKVQYPAGTQFTGVEMTVEAVQTSQSTFAQRLAGTAYAKALCIVYAGESGYCIDYRVTCSKMVQKKPVTIPCPATPSPQIGVLTSFDTAQQIVNPGFLTTPIGTDNWTNILDEFFLTRIDPTAHGRTKGFSEFVAVSLGATNKQGQGNLTFNAPLRPVDPRSFAPGTVIGVSFNLASDLHASTPITDATAGLSVLMVANNLGQPVSRVIFNKQNAFQYESGSYRYALSTTGYAAGTYVITVYGDAFASQEVSFTIK